jgi:hypothetical protein
MKFVKCTVLDSKDKITKVLEHNKIFAHLCPWKIEPLVKLSIERIHTSYLCKGYETPYSDWGLLFETDATPDIVLPLDLKIISEVINVLKRRHKNGWEKELNQYVCKSVKGLSKWKNVKDARQSLEQILVKFGGFTLDEVQLIPDGLEFFYGMEHNDVIFCKKNIDIQNLAFFWNRPEDNWYRTS